MKDRKSLFLIMSVGVFLSILAACSPREIGIERVENKADLFFDSGPIFPSPTPRHCDVEKFIVNRFQGQLIVENRTTIQLNVGERISIYARLPNNCKDGILFDWQVKFGKILSKNGNGIVYQARADFGSDSIRVNIRESNQTIGTGQFSINVQ